MLNGKRKKRGEGKLLSVVVAIDGGEEILCKQSFHQTAIDWLIE
jgi:hypothetical protein